LIIKVPPGTLVKDEQTGRILADLVKPGKKVVIAKGGKVEPEISILRLREGRCQVLQNRGAGRRAVGDIGA